MLYLVPREEPAVGQTPFALIFRAAPDLKTPHDPAEDRVSGQPDGPCCTPLALQAQEAAAAPSASTAAPSHPHLWAQHQPSPTLPLPMQTTRAPRISHHLKIVPTFGAIFSILGKTAMFLSNETKIATRTLEPFEEPWVWHCY